MLTFSFLYHNIGSQIGGQCEADLKAKLEVVRLVDSDMAGRKKARDDGKLKGVRQKAIGKGL